ncbi:MAG: phosphatase PAP2 family protein, partial [Dehalococcoidia bacterium]
FAAATGVWLGHHRKAGIVLYVLASIWALSRFYAGMHFFVDIAGGAAIGVLISLITTKVLMPRSEPIPSLALRLARFLYIA